MYEICWMQVVVHLSAVDVSFGSLAVNQHINVVGKVTKVDDVTDVKSKNSSKDLLKQDCTIADRI